MTTHRRASWYSRLFATRRPSLRQRRWRPVLGVFEERCLPSNTVSVVAEFASASELGPNPGIFKFTRTGSLSAPLSVNYSLSGTATSGSDYQVWETTANFPAGVDTARVTIMPRNDSRLEGTESVVLTITSGTGYTIGSASTATVNIQDDYVQGFPGVFGQVSVNPQTGLPLITPDLTYLDASVSGGYLNVAVGMASSSLTTNLEIFLNTDQNMSTGDWRSGHVAGQDYRIHAMTGIFGGYELYRIPTSYDDSVVDQYGNVQPEQDHLITTGSVSQNGNLLFVSIPLSLLGNPTAVDAFVTGDIGAANNDYNGIGDRVPLYGALDTSTDQVVVRRPGATQIVVVNDTINDLSGSGFDLTSAELDTVGDQFFVRFNYTQYFDPTDPTHFPGPRGEIQFDSDHNILTGAIPMGGSIATWGGDAKIFYDIDSLFASAPTVLVQQGGGDQVPFGGGLNDGRWLGLNNSLFLSGSLSMLDPVVTTISDDSVNATESTQRIATNGQMVFQTWTLTPTFGLDNTLADSLPNDRTTVVDSITGQTLLPLTWLTGHPLATDPQEYGSPGLSGADLIQVDAEVTQNNLVVRGTLSSWLNTDVWNLFDVLLDTDMNANTAPRGFGYGMGADYDVRVESVDSQGAPVYRASIIHPDGTITRTDAILTVLTSSLATAPGAFTVTIPLSALGNPRPQLRMLLTTANADGAGLLDVAPSDASGTPSPFVINTGGGALVTESGGSTNVTEGGATDSYTVVLTSQPTANVTISVNPDSQETVSPSTLTFTPSNWNTPQTVTVTAVDDSVAQGNHTGTITHSASSTDPTYNGIPIASVTVHITDNDQGSLTVSNTNDSGAGSLRQAILNANSNPGPDIIRFNIGTGAKTINLLSGLPTISDPVTIDGTSQPGYAGVPLIELNGVGAGNASGLVITAGNSTVQGLVINRFTYSAIDLETNGGDVIQGNYLGTDVTGTADQGNGLHGVFVGSGSSNNLIGGTTAATRNVIAGNNDTGVWVDGPSGNRIEGNYIGTDKNGTAALGNSHYGILVSNGASNNIIGGTVAGAGNVIAASGYDGIQITDAGTNNNTVWGNFIGTDKNGTTALGNGLEGVRVHNGAANNMIGGTSAGSGNLVSGNQDTGIWIADAGSSGNVVEGNLIGTDKNGRADLGNALHGVLVSNGATNNTIGGTSLGAGNVISANNDTGVWLKDSGTQHNLIQGNLIGTDTNGTAALGNSHYGVFISAGATNNTVGGTATGAGNVLSANAWAGVGLAGTGTTGNLVQGNLIGTNKSGGAALGNGQKGVLIFSGASGNTIGGTTRSASNVVSGNTGLGVWITDAGTSSNVIEGNLIGVALDGVTPLGNTQSGVLVSNGAASNVIGGTQAGAGNLISANQDAGIWLRDSGTIGNLVQGNRIGTDQAGAALGNATYGVFISLGASGNIIGGTAAGASNIIANNGFIGVGITDSASTGNALRANAIYGNAELGIDLGIDGVSVNDSGDSDTGPNNLQNYPVITLVQPGSSTRVAGTINSTPNTVLTLDFFANDAGDPSGNGEGQRYLGSTAITTDANGNANFDVTLTTATSASDLLTATATNPAGSTSEFSAAFAASVTNIGMVQATTDGATTLSVTYQITAVPSTAFRIGFYNSSDTSFDSGDTLLGSMQISDPADLSVGQHTKIVTIGSAAGQVALPGAGSADTGADTFVLVVADDQNVVSESDNDPFNGNNTVALSGAYHLAGGDVLVQGTASADTVTLAVSGSNVVLTFNGVNTTYAASDVTGFRVRGHDGADVITATGMTRPVIVWGGAGNDQIVGGNGNDSLLGGADDDLLEGGPGNDTLLGGTGNDTYVFRTAVGTETDVVSELAGEGTDTLDFSNLPASVPVTVNLASDTALAKYTGRTIKTAASGQAVNFENATGGAGNDKLTGNKAANDLVGGAGNDALTGGTGNDVLDGGAGNDHYIFLAATAGPQVVTVIELSGTANGTKDLLDFSKLTASNPLTVDLTSDTTLASFTSCTVQTGISGQADNFEYVTGGAGNDSITGNAGNNSLVGGTGDDTILGGAGNDTLDGGFGSDSLVGGAGNDRYLFRSATKGAEVDTVVELAGEGTADLLDFGILAATDPVRVDLTNDSVLASHTNRTVQTGAAGQAANFERVTGGKGNDVLIGNAANNSLIGGTGNDTMTGGLGNDTLNGSTGTDLLVEIGDVNFTLTTTKLTGLGTDKLAGFEQAQLTGGAGNNIINAAAFSGSVTLIGGAGNDTLTAAAGPSVVLGGAGNDTLTGSGNRDLLVGGSGRDSLAGGAGDDVLVAGLLSYENEATEAIDFASLSALMQEWTSAASYSLRISHLLSGGGLNGTARLNSSTITDDGIVDQLFGQADNDWFLASATDVVNDQASGETITLI